MKRLKVKVGDNSEILIHCSDGEEQVMVDVLGRSDIHEFVERWLEKEKRKQSLHAV